MKMSMSNWFKAIGSSAVSQTLNCDENQQNIIVYFLKSNLVWIIRMHPNLETLYMLSNLDNKNKFK